MDKALETKVFQRFVAKPKQQRYLTFIANEKTRGKFTAALAHFGDLRDECFEPIRSNENGVIKERLKVLGALRDCYLISENPELDGKRFAIDIALSHTIGHGMGTLIVFGDAEIVFYEAEGPNDRWISKPLKKD
jgi:hypothetical protein